MRGYTLPIPRQPFSLFPSLTFHGRELYALIKQAIQDISQDPERLGAKGVSELVLEGVRAYRLSYRRQRVSAPRVKHPRHFLPYRRRGDVIELAPLLHDSSQLEQHLPPNYRPPK